MCWSAEVSLKTWYFAVAGLLIGLYGGFPLHKLIFVMVFSTIQLVEYFIWKNLQNPAKNQLYSILGHIVILLEPLAALLLVPSRKVALCVAILYIVLMSRHVYQVYSTDAEKVQENKFTTKVGENGHLLWPFVKGFGNWTGILWFVVFFFGVVMSRDLVIMLVATVALAYSTYKSNYTGTFTTLWCNYSNTLWVWIILWVVAKKLGLRLFLRK